MAVGTMTTIVTPGHSQKRLRSWVFNQLQLVQKADVFTKHLKIVENIYVFTYSVVPRIYFYQDCGVNQKALTT